MGLQRTDLFANLLQFSLNIEKCILGITDPPAQKVWAVQEWSRGDFFWFYVVQVDSVGGSKSLTLLELYFPLTLKQHVLILAGRILGATDFGSPAGVLSGFWWFYEALGRSVVNLVGSGGGSWDLRP